jgi:hypothetical protein
MRPDGLAVSWLRPASQHRKGKKLLYVSKDWRSFGGAYSTLESDYETAVNRVMREREIVGFVTHKEQSSCSCSFGTAALTLWRMAWEGFMHPVMLELHSHPAFGIAVWLSLHPRPHKNAEVASEILLCEFQSALEASLGHAIVLAHVMHSRATYLLEPRLLRPSIFDCTCSQRLTK